MIECNHDFTFCNIIVKKPSLFGLKKMIIERINLQNCPTNMTAFAFRIEFEGDEADKEVRLVRPGGRVLRHRVHL